MRNENSDNEITPPNINPSKPLTRKRKRKLISKSKSVKRDQIIMNYKELYDTVKNRKELNDRHIDAANQLLKSQFPNIQGLSTPILGQKFCLPCFQFCLAASGYPYFQVLHCASLQHWIAISIDVNEVVSVYDSLFNSDVMI